MLILNPREVTFGGATWPNVTHIAIDRSSTRLAIDWSDNGPHPTFADAPEHRVDIKIVMDIDQGDLNGPKPGDQAALTFITSPTTTDASRRRISSTAVVTAIEHEVSQKRGSIRTLTLVALSTDGAADPITITDA